MAITTSKQKVIYARFEQICRSYLYAAIGITSVTGNTLTLIILLRGNYNLSPYTYMTSLAACDLIGGIAVLFFGIIANNNLLYNYAIIREMIFHGTAAGFTIGMVVSVSASLLAMVLGIDRMIAVTFPLHRHVWCTVRRARIISVIILIFSTFINIHTPFRVKYAWIRDPVHDILMPTPFYTVLGRNKQFNRAIINITLFVRMLLPFSVMLTTNILTIRTLYKRRRNQKDLTAQADGEKRGKKIPCLASTIGVIVAFVFTHILRAAKYIEWSIELPQGSFIGEITTALSDVLAWSNSAVNFFIYIALNKRFRREIQKLFICDTKCLKYVKNQDSTSETKGSNAKM